MDILDQETEPVSKTKAFFGHAFFYLSFLLALWFFLTSWFWIAFLNVVFSYPAGFFSLLLLLFGKSFDPAIERYKTIEVALIAGVLISAVAFVLFFML